MEAAPSQPSLNTTLDNLSTEYTKSLKGEAVDELLVAQNLVHLYQLLGPNCQKDPDLQLIFGKCGPLVKDQQPLPLEVWDLIYPERHQRSQSSIKRRLAYVAAMLGLGSLTITGGAPLIGEVRALIANGGPKPISYEGGRLFSPGGESPALIDTRQTQPATESVKPQESLFSEFLKPFITEAMKQRAEREKADPEFSKRVDKQLKDRINFLLFSYGESFSLQSGQIVNIGTDQIISLNTKTNTIDLISITHDTRTPEAEQYLRGLGKQTPPTKIDGPYLVGGFDLMRKTFENATGLSMDFQAVLQDTAILRLIDKVFEGITVDIPTTITTERIAIEGKIYGQEVFEKGKRQLNGRQALQFMKGEDAAGYVPERGFHQRKHTILAALKEAFQNNLPNPVFWTRLVTYLKDEKGERGGIKIDFDETTLLPSPLSVGTTFLRTRNVGSVKIGQSIFIMDAGIGDGGVQWVTANAHENPKTKEEIDKGIYQDLAMEIPLNADPYSSDLVSNYWQSTRQIIKQRLTQ